jgi:agmatine deiminase
MSQGVTPAAQGYFMPAEWERHEATWLSWPHDPVTWPERVPQTEKAFEQMIRALAPGERIELLCNGPAVEQRARDHLEGLASVRYHRVTVADSWTRDYCPTFVVRNGKAGRELGAVKWIFNAWGNKYDALLPDDKVGQWVAQAVGCPMFEPGMVMEGGSLEADGEGTLLTTEQCLLNPNRNPGHSRADLDHVLRDCLGVSKVLWLGDGIAGDDTDGHVDDVSRFVAPGVVLTAVEEDEAHPNHAPLQANADRLREMRDAKGRDLWVLEMPMPGDVLDAEGGPLPASYMNFYVGNAAVVLPVFGHKNDAKATRVLAELFPDRRIVPIRCEDLVWGFGALHCVTQQVPRTVAR